MATLGRCYLKCLRDAQKHINLPHEKPVILGRNPQTGITDLQVSRNHLQFIANHDSSKVLVKALGKSHSGCNGCALMPGESYTLKHGDRIEVRLGFHEYEIIFESPENECEPPSKKPKFDIFNINRNQPSSSSKPSGLWEEIDNRALLIYSQEQCIASSKIAGFDIDGTIIKTKSGARFPKNETDWIFNINSIPQKLKQLHDSNHKIVLFTNQSGLGNDSNKIKSYKNKIESIASSLAVPIQVFIATSESIYRKPIPGMWNTLSETKNNNETIDLTSSFYVGDAAGREKNWAPKKNKDHSFCDRLFALNIGIKFYTPEEYFLKSSSVKFLMPEFDPKSILDVTEPHSMDFGSVHEVIIMVGEPGSGKSYYCKNQLRPKGYVHISRDNLGSWQKCVKELEDRIQSGKSVVIDNTNPTKENRQRFINVTKKYNISCRCFLMTTSHRHAKHNNRFRNITDKHHQVIGDMVLHSYRKTFEKPEISEGFKEIVSIPFIPKFTDPKQEKLYRLFLLED